jgi:hypothetical protein
MDSLSKIYEQRKQQKDSSVLKQIERLQRIQGLFTDLQNRTDQRKIDCTIAFKRYFTNFENSIDIILQKLQSGELITTDILQFENNLSVRPLDYLICKALFVSLSHRHPHSKKTLNFYFKF